MSWPARIPAIRMVDMLIAGVGLLVTAPLMVVIALAVRATSPGPALFRQRRLGYRERPFEMLKFRTMTADCDDAVHREYVTRMLAGSDPRPCGPSGLFKLDSDARITPLGRLLRRTSLDELPQLINVLRGDMSLVGPRPAMPWEVGLYQPRHRVRFEVKPGITGLWQVRGRSRLSSMHALELDVEYVRRHSLRLYLWILLLTVPAVLRVTEAR